MKKNVACGMNIGANIASAVPQETTADLMASEEFVDVGFIEYSGDAINIEEFRLIAHRLLQACDHFTMPTKCVASTNTQPFNEQQTLPKTKEQLKHNNLMFDDVSYQELQEIRETTQTESIMQQQYDDGRATECCARGMADMDKLKVKLKQVVDMNVKWQLWHDECQKHTSDLKKQINDLRQQTNTTSTTTAGSASWTQLVSDLGQSDDHGGEGHSSETTPEDSVHVSRFTNTGRVGSDFTEMQAQNCNLRKELEESLTSSREIVDRLTSDNHEKQSLIEVLKAQVVLYREDFENERQDRQRAQSKLSALAKELGELKETTTCRQQPLHRVPSSHVSRRYTIASTPAAATSSPPLDAARGMRRSTTAVNKTYRPPLHGPSQYRRHTYDVGNMGYFDDIENDA